MKSAVEGSYILAAFLFVFGLKMMSSPDTARRGNGLSALGMLLAVVVTLLHRDIIGYRWIAIGLALGTLIGVMAARFVAMTDMPGMVGLLNGSGGVASLLVAWNEYHRHRSPDAFTAATIVLSVLIGGVTFTGSVMAWAKLGGKVSGRPVLFHGQQVVNGLLLLGCAGCGTFYALNPPASYLSFLVLVSLSLALGVTTVIPIGGADMPVVISLLNSYSGLAGCATGFVLKNEVLVVTGALVGSSGIILTRIMCRAMNRPLTNVLFSGFGAVRSSENAAARGEARAISAEDAWVLLEAARSVVVVPGYGMAVAHAQHAVRELGELLERNGAEVRYAIHPVAGRMPGHMNVLLAEADVPYDALFDMDAVNPTLASVDVCLVVGANDIVNPAAREDKSSPIYGMPIIEAGRARSVLVLKRSLAPGFAGLDNRLFYKENTRLLFGDAKASLESLVAQFKGASI